jgi:hypothetical protein
LQLRLGRTSVTYEIGLFRKGADAPAAFGHFVHVFVGRASRKPAAIPAGIRAALLRIARSDGLAGGPGCPFPPTGRGLALLPNARHLETISLAASGAPKFRRVLKFEKKTRAGAEANIFGRHTW